MKRFLLLWLIGALLIALGLGRVNLPGLYSLTRRGIETCGTLTAFESNNHRTVHYSYEVNGKMYSGIQQGGAGERVTALSSRCQGYEVFYLPEAPHISCIGDPLPMLWNEVITLFLVILIFPPFALLASRWRSPAFRLWLKAEGRKK